MQRSALHYKQNARSLRFILHSSLVVSCQSAVKCEKKDGKRLERLILLDFQVDFQQGYVFKYDLHIAQPIDRDYSGFRMVQAPFRLSIHRLRV